jgi:hypothetical protein
MILIKEDGAILTSVEVKKCPKTPKSFKKYLIRIKKHKNSQ